MLSSDPSPWRDWVHRRRLQRDRFVKMLDKENLRERTAALRTVDQRNAAFDTEAGQDAHPAVCPALMGWVANGLWVLMTLSHGGASCFIAWPVRVVYGALFPCAQIGLSNEAADPTSPAQPCLHIRHTHVHVPG